MAGFLYKDLRASRLFILLVLLVHCLISGTVFSIYLINRNEMTNDIIIIIIVSYYLMFVLISAGNQGVFNGDERSVWQYFAISTPGAMKAQIQSKYLLFLFLNLLVFSCCMLTDTVSVLIIRDSNYTMALPLMILFCWNNIKDSISLPFSYRYGVSYGNKVRIFLLVVMLTVIGIYGLFGDISIFMSKGFLDTIKLIFTEGNGIWVIAIIPYVAGLGYYLSYRISLLVYRRGIENYE